MEDANKILSEISDLKTQQIRFAAHFESEIGNWTRQIGELSKVVRELELWKANMQGRIFVLGFVAGAAVSVIIAVLVWLITKK